MKIKLFFLIGLHLIVHTSTKAQNQLMEKLKEDFIEYATYVNVSRQMLQNIFEEESVLTHNTSAGYKKDIISISTLEAYSSISISTKEQASFPSAELYARICSTLNKDKFEQYMEVNKGNVNKRDHSIIRYYQKKNNDKNNEIYILQQQPDYFSVIYIKGNIDIKYISVYLRIIRYHLKNMETSSLPVDYLDSEDIFLKFRDLGSFDLDQNISRFREQMPDMKIHLPEFDFDSLFQELQKTQEGLEKATEQDSTTL